MHSVVVIGSGGNALDVLDVVDAIRLAGRDWEVRGFLDDARAAGTSHVGLPVLGRVEDAGGYSDASFINAIGSDKTFRLRPAIVTRTGLPRERFATLVHPTASVSKRARLGHGTCVNHGVSIGGGAVVGDHVYMGVGCIIGHDAVIEDYAVIAPGAIISGFTRIGQNSYIGAGVIVKQTKQVGAGAIVGMGAVVCKDVPAGATWVGNPAGPHEPARRATPTGLQAVETRG
jgi:sugar O-acyltransferase (sialic acid O-acetyltransferase NeuD family)